MADRIKGITIEIGGDTTGLSKALKAVNSDLRTAQNGLKDVNRLLKMDPGNVDLLKQKQGYLNDTISKTKEKLEQEKAALEQLKNSDSFDKNSEQAKALERQIIADEQELKDLKNQSKEFGSVASQQFKAVAEKVSEVGTKLQGIGDSLTKKVSVPIMAVGAASVAAFNEVDTGMDIIVTKTGATGEALEDMQQRAQNLATSIPTNFETAGTAIGDVSTRFGIMGDDLETLSGQYIKFAAITGTDVTTAIEGTQKALAAFGLGAEDASGLLDTLNAVGQQTGASMDTLISGLTSNSAAFQEMGLSIDQAAMFMGEMETSGADASAVMSGLQKALKNATEDGIPLNDALAQLQNTILNGTASTDGLTAAYDLFGKSGAQVFEAVKNGTLDFSNLSNAVVDASGSVSDTFAATLDPMDQWKTTLNDLKIAGAELGSAIQTTLAPIIEKVSETVKSLTEKFEALSPAQKEMIVKIGLVVAAIGPLISIIGTLMIGIEGIMLFVSGPVLVGIAAAVAAIGSIIAIGKLLIDHWDDIKSWLAKLKADFDEKFTAMKTAVTEKFTAMKTTATEMFEAIRSSITSKTEAIYDTVTGKFQAIKDSITEKINAAKEAVRTAIDHIKNFLNFHWELPHLALPHFSISGSINPMDWFTQGVPHINVEWYRKAYDNPVMFTSPTVLQTPGGYKGFGDGSGPEIVMGLNKLRELVGDMAGAPIQVIVNGAEGQSVNALAEEIEKRLVHLQQQRAAVWR